MPEPKQVPNHGLLNLYNRTAGQGITYSKGDFPLLEWLRRIGAVSEYEIGQDRDYHAEGSFSKKTKKLSISRPSPTVATHEALHALQEALRSNPKEASLFFPQEGKSRWMDQEVKFHYGKERDEHYAALNKDAKALYAAIPPGASWSGMTRDSSKEFFQDYREIAAYYMTDPQIGTPGYTERLGELDKFLEAAYVNEAWRRALVSQMKEDARLQEDRLALRLHKQGFRIKDDE